MIQVLIVDDHAIVRRGLRQLLSEDKNVEVIADAASAHEALSILREQSCDIVLLDLTMPEKHGLELLDDLIHEFPTLRILVLSMHSEEQFGIRVLKAGASGYLTKDGDPDHILKAIHKIVKGGKYITPLLAELLEFHLHHKTTQHPHEILSAREFAVFRGIISGKPLSTIADELSLSVKTVSNYRARALEKMNMKSNADLIHYAHRNSLIL